MLSSNSSFSTLLAGFQACLKELNICFLQYTSASCCGSVRFWSSSLWELKYVEKGAVRRLSLKAKGSVTCNLQAYGQVDEDGSRYLLGDIAGNLYLLVLTHDGHRVLGLKLQTLGRTSAASTIAYLDNAVVYVGSATGDSQLVRLHPEAVVAEQPGNFVEVLDTFTNLGPIIDMCVVDLDRQGQGQVSAVRRRFMS